MTNPPLGSNADSPYSMAMHGQTERCSSDISQNRVAPLVMVYRIPKAQHTSLTSIRRSSRLRIMVEAHASRVKRAMIWYRAAVSFELRHSKIAHQVERPPRSVPLGPTGPSSGNFPRTDRLMMWGETTVAFRGEKDNECPRTHLEKRPPGRRNSDAMAIIVVHIEPLNRPHTDQWQ